MFGSNDSLDDFFPELPNIPERKVIPLKCWQDVRLSDIWIHSNLLTSRKEASNTQKDKGLLHTLEDRNSVQCIEGFSVYSDEDEEEIFKSDSDEDFLGLETKSSEEHEGYRSENTLVADSGDSFKDLRDKNDTGKTCQNSKNEVRRNEISSLQHSKVNDYSSERRFKSLNSKTFNQKEKKKTSSRISLNETSQIKGKTSLDKTPEIDVKNFKSDFSKCNEFLGIQSKESEIVQQKKNKAKNSTALDKFSKNYNQKIQDYYCNYNEKIQDYYCNAYFNRLLMNKHKNSSVQQRNTAEFPNVASNELKFMHSKKIKTNSEPSTVSKMDKIKTVLSIEETANTPKFEPISDSLADIAIENTYLEQHRKSGRIVIENIPREVSPRDIQALLFSYGEIKRFSLKSVGEFHKVYIEIEDCDIEWITECLNGTELFGASSKILRCYQEQ